MFEWLGKAVIRLRWFVIAVGILTVVVGSAWGSGVFAELSGGFTDPNSESAKAAGRINAELGRQQFDLLVLYSSASATVEDPGFRDPLVAKIADLRKRSEVDRVVSVYDTPTPTLVSKDKHATYLVVYLSGVDADARTAAYQKVKDDLAVPGLDTRIGGPEAVFGDIATRTAADVKRAELLSLPVLLLLMLLVFGSVVAATTPLVIGVLAIFGAFVATRLITMVTEVSVFAINIITILGLGLAVDYALFVVSRFREELAAGSSPNEAVIRTMRTAGRTIAVSGITVALALASLLLFPQPFLRSMGYGGMAAVLVAMVSALTVLPALLAVLGRRIDALRIALGRGRHLGVGADVDGRGAWARFAASVMRRPVAYVAGAVVVLGVLAVPFTGISFGGIDERVLPAGTESRMVAERIRDDFPGGDSNAISVLVSGADPAATAAFTQRVEEVPKVSDVAPVAEQGRSTLLRVNYLGSSTSEEALEAIVAIRGLTPPDGAEVKVAGPTAELVDLLDSVGRMLPWMALVVVVVTFALLYAAFRSILLPLQAIVMNALSVGASFGVVTWIFQDGHLSGWLGFTPTGHIDATQPILMLAVLFGLSTDYELFLLSRIREEWLRTGDNTTAVAAGIQKTGRIITSAAMLLMVVVAGFSTSSVSVVKLIGVGMLVAILVDATLVRLFLVPATMRLLGQANWWPASRPGTTTTDRNPRPLSLGATPDHNR